MNVTLQLTTVYIKNTKYNPDEEHIYSPKGAVVNVYDSDNVATWDGSKYALNTAVATDKNWGFVHILNFPDIPIMELKNALRTPLTTDDYNLLRNYPMRFDIDALPAANQTELASTLETTVQFTYDYFKRIAYNRDFELDRTKDTERVAELRDLNG